MRCGQAALPRAKNRWKDAKGCKRTLSRRLQPLLWLILMDRVLARLRLELLRSLAVEGVGGLDVCSLLALGASGDVKRYALAFLEGFEAAGVDCRVMREEVLATVFRGDEAKAFCVVKPFHCSACHFDAPDWGRYFATHI